MRSKEPFFVVELPTPKKAGRFRSAAGPSPFFAVLESRASALWTFRELDALYLSLPRAERWGSRPLPPHTAAILETTVVDQHKGLPRFVVTGLTLGQGEENTATNCVPLIVRAVRRAVALHNAANEMPIRAVGFFEHELTFAGSSLSDVARVFAAAVSQ